MIKWTVLILLLLLAFGKKIMTALGMDCACESYQNGGGSEPGTPGSFPGSFPNDNILTSQAEIDVELHQRAEDQDIQNLSNDMLVKKFFPGTQTLQLTQLSYDKNYI